MAKISSESQFFSGNIANIIPEGPLNKMVPLTEDRARGPPLAHGLNYVVQADNDRPMLTRSAPLRNEVALTCTTCLATKSSKTNPRAVSPLGLIDITRFM